MIIGFGSTETKQQEKVGYKLYDIVSNYIKKGEDGGDYDKFYIDKIEKEVKEFEKEIGDKYEIADKSTPKPQRYFRFIHTRIAQNYDTLFISMMFWHINSQHGLTDGMSLMQEYKTFSFNYDEYHGLKLF